MRLLSFLALCILVTGCKETIIPVQVDNSQYSWDGTNHNSGFIGWAADGSGIITPHARDRYNGLIALYGKRFDPPITNDYQVSGVTSSNTFIISPEALSKFDKMQRFKKNPRLQ